MIHFVRIIALNFALLIFPSLLCGSEEVGAFLDQYQRVIASSVSVTQRISLRSYVGERSMPERIMGVVTWGGKGEPFLCATLQRDDVNNPESSNFSMVSLSCRGDSFRMADSALGAYYEGRLSESGASLIASRLDVVLCTLMYPGIMDSFRNGEGSVVEEMEGNIPVFRMEASDNFYKLVIVVHKDSFLPIRIERIPIGSDSEGGIRYVCDMSTARVSKLQPPEEIFDVNSLYSFPRKVYDPGNLLGKEAPPFDARMVDGGNISLKALRGKWVILFFHSEGDRVRPASAMYIERAGDRARAAGAVFLDIYSQSGSYLGPVNAYYPATTCQSDYVMKIYSVDRTGLPCVVLISPEGKVVKQLIGYIPALTERAIDRVLVDLESDALNAGL